MYTVYLEPLSCQRQRVTCMVAGDKALIDSILGNSKVKDDAVGDITFEDNMRKLLGTGFNWCSVRIAIRRPNPPPSAIRRPSDFIVT
jgi:hypothetical protein